MSAHVGQDAGTSIKNASAIFLGTPYGANRLIGSNTEKEQLVIDLGHLDCFTYLDYVESLRQSDSMLTFFENIINTRYSSGQIDYLSRKHFFSDWISDDHHNITDVTSQISPKFNTVTKYLNQKNNGETYIAGLNMSPRKITYIRGVDVNHAVISKLKDGDYIGIYTNINGLDVTHTGIFIRDNNGPVLRHASSSSVNRKVVDSPFIDYVKSKPGILVYRAQGIKKASINLAP
ncbi:DUF1460 domain-containing protein [Shewanella sp. VB17]|nr:DUF1460 domain-containing protein [Shewanella sp. VB17]